MHHEGDAAVELVEPQRFAQRVAGCPARRGSWRSWRPTTRSRSKILPVEPPRRRRRARGRPRRPAARSAPAAPAPRPSGCGVSQVGMRRLGNGRRRRRDVVEVENELALLEEARARPHRALRRAPRSRATASARRAPTRRPRAGSAARRAGLSVMSATAWTMRSRSGARGGPSAAHRVGEAQPFGAVVVAMLEQVLRQGHPEPPAQPARRQHGQRRPRRRARRSRAGPAAARSLPSIGQALRDEDHRRPGSRR